MVNDAGDSVHVRYSLVVMCGLLLSLCTSSYTSWLYIQVYMQLYLDEIPMDCVNSCSCA